MGTPERQNDDCLEHYFLFFFNTLFRFRNVSADVDWLKATIQWQPALQDGGDGAYPVTVWYSVQCTTCKKELVYSPQWKNIQGNSVSVSGLQPSTSYTFRVYSENVVSDRFDSKVKSFKDVTFITNAAGIAIGRKNIKTRRSFKI